MTERLGTVPPLDNVTLWRDSVAVVTGRTGSVLEIVGKTGPDQLAMIVSRGSGSNSLVITSVGLVGWGWSWAFKSAVEA